MMRTRSLGLSLLLLAITLVFGEFAYSLPNKSPLDAHLNSFSCTRLVGELTPLELAFSVEPTSQGYSDVIHRLQQHLPTASLIRLDFSTNKNREDAVLALASAIDQISWLDPSLKAQLIGQLLNRDLFFFGALLRVASNVPQGSRLLIILEDASSLLNTPQLSELHKALWSLGPIADTVAFYRAPLKEVKRSLNHTQANILRLSDERKPVSLGSVENESTKAAVTETKTRGITPDEQKLIAERVHFSQLANRQLERLPPEVRTLVLEKWSLALALAENPNNVGVGSNRNESIDGIPANRFKKIRFSVKTEYRIIFRVVPKNKAVIIEAIGTRESVYSGKFRRLGGIRKT